MNIDYSNNLSDMNFLYKAYITSMSRSSWKHGSQRFERDYLSELVKLSNELESRTYKTSKGSEFILKERAKTRYVHGNVIRDRIVRHVLCDNIIHPSIEPYLIYSNGASQKGKGTDFERKLFENDLHNFYLEYGDNDGYVGFIDFSKFFDNIHHDKALKMLESKINKDVQWLLEAVFDNFAIDVSYMNDNEYSECMYKKFDSIKYHKDIPDNLKTGDKYMRKSVDIGDQVSQEVGIFYPTRIDIYATVVRGCKRYGRYMDDIYIILRDKDELISVMNGIFEEADKLGIFINIKKTKIYKLSDNFKYLQYKYRLNENGKVIKRINPKTVHRERRKLKGYKRLLIKGIINYNDIENCYKSWLGTYAKRLSKKQLDNMQNLYYNLFGRNVRWKK